MESTLGRFLGQWIASIEKRAHFVVAGISLILVLLGVFASFNLGVNSDVNAMVAADVAFRQREDAFREAFSTGIEAILVVVESDEPMRAKRAAARLAEELEPRTDLFRRVNLPGAGDFFKRNALLYLTPSELETLGDRLAEAQPLIEELGGTESLDGVARLLARALRLEREGTETGFDVTTTLAKVSGVIDATLEGQRTADPWGDGAFMGDLAQGSRLQVISIEPVLDFEDLLAAEGAIAAIRETARDLRLDEANGFRVRITGDPVLNFEEVFALQYQGIAVGLGSLLLVSGALFLALRSARVVSATVLNLIGCLVATGAFAAATIGELNQLSISFSVLIIGLGVDFGIHLCMRYAHQSRLGHNRRRALIETGRRVGPALVVCALTTAVGFFVFVPTDFRGVAELGLITGFGIFISLFLSITYLPALLSLGSSERTTGVRDHAVPAWVASLQRFPIRHARPICVTALVVAFLTVPLVDRLKFNNNAVDLRDPTTESVQAFNDLLSESRTSPWTVDLIAPNLESAVVEAQAIGRLPYVKAVMTVADFVPDRQQEKREIIEMLEYFLPRLKEGEAGSQPETGAALTALHQELVLVASAAGSPDRVRAASTLRASVDRLLASWEPGETTVALRTRLARNLTGSLPEQIKDLQEALDPELVTLETLPTSLRQTMLADDGRARIVVTPADDLSDPAALERFVGTVQSFAPEATGPATLMIEWGRLAIRSMQQALTLAVLCMSLLLWSIWRRAADVLLAMFPMLLAALYTAGAMVLLGVDLNLANVTVLPMLMGIGVDSGIHLISRYREAARGEDLLASSAARAVVFSAVTTLAGFVSLAFAPHKGMAALGQVLSLGLVFTLISTLVVLPALLAWLGSPDQRAALVKGLGALQRVSQ